MAIHQKRRVKSKQTIVIDVLSVELSRWFGTKIKFTTADIRTKTEVKLTPGEIRGAINHMKNSGMLYRRGTCRETGYGEWMLTKRGIVRANKALERMECLHA